jgi:hypothetical protein
MRTKLLIAIACLLGLCVGFGACVKGNEDAEMNISTYVTAFGIDTIYGKYYKFTIDQVNHMIFNADSLPLGSDTLLDRIVIDTFSSSGYITSGLLDSLVTVGDSVNLLPAINKPGITFKIISNDGNRIQEYNLQVNVHKVDPDLATWKNIEGLPAEFVAAKSTDQKVLIRDNKLMVFLRGDLLLKSDISSEAAYSWKTYTVTGLPADAMLHSTLCYNDTLYMISKSGDLYNSLEGEVWIKNETLSGGVRTLLASFADKLTAIKTEAGQLRYCLTHASTEAWTSGVLVHEGFPIDRVSSDVYVSGTGVERAILVGTPMSEEYKTTPWMTIDGDDWGAMSTETSYYCPMMDNPSVMFYNKFFYIVGDELEEMYESMGGLVWALSVGKFQLPEAVEGHQQYALTVDDANYIWILVIGNGSEHTQLWRGRLNELNK